MSISELGSLGEFLAAFGVVASLIFVGIQMRLNTKEMQLRRSIDSNEEWSRFRRMLIEAGDVADILLRGQRGDESLDAIETLRFQLIVREHLRLAENQYRRVSLGYTTTGGLEAVRQQVRWLLRSSIASNLWETLKSDYQQDFVADIER